MDCGGNLGKMRIELSYFYVKMYEELIVLVENPNYENVYFDYVDHDVIRVFCRKKVIRLLI